MAIPGVYLIKTYSEGCCSNRIHEAAGRVLEAYSKALETAGMTSNTAWWIEVIAGSQSQFRGPQREPRLHSGLPRFY